MRTKLRGQVTLDDVQTLKRIYRDMTALLTGLHPASEASHAGMCVLWALRACHNQWTGLPDDHPNTPHSIRLGLNQERDATPPSTEAPSA